MRPRDKTAAEVAAVGRPRAVQAPDVRHDWQEKNDEAFGALRTMKQAMIGSSLVNYATAPVGAKKYEGSSLSR
jgi:hypothetical protein